MRQNLIIVLLTVCATLLVANLVVQMTRRPAPVFGQTTGAAESGFILATGPTASGNESILYVLDTKGRRLAAYMTRTRGIEFKGVRTLEHDLKPDWLAPQGARVLKPDDVAKVFREAEERASKKR